MNHISVCVCTYQRPELLEKLLLALEGQRTDELFTFSAVVVDNDKSELARETITHVRTKVSYSIDYFVEPRQNIAAARNKGILNATGDYIATIDDDEIPSQQWLYLLFNALHSYHADGILGPVLPSFGPEVPAWLVKSGLCDRDSFESGTVLTRSHRLRTGNTLLDRRIFKNGKNLFREQFGLTGGEDSEFFDERICEGFRFVWCDEARAFEEVPPSRWPLSFHLRKAVRIGALTGEKMRIGTVPLWGNLLKSVCATFGLAVTLPVSAALGKHIMARFLVKCLYHASRLLGTVGVVLIRER
jgi:succinoglycan biosynthesis protein ExoM